MNLLSTEERAQIISALVEGNSLRAIQKEIGVPVSESIRRAIDQYLEQRGKKK